MRSPQNLFLIGRERYPSLVIEIAARHLRVAVSLTGEKPCTVSAILAEQGGRVVLRVSLQENEQTVFVLDKNVGACLGRPRHDAVAFGNERRLRQVVVA